MKEKSPFFLLPPPKTILFIIGLAIFTFVPVFFVSELVFLTFPIGVIIFLLALSKRRLSKTTKEQALASIISKRNFFTFMLGWLLFTFGPFIIGALAYAIAGIINLFGATCYLSAASAGGCIILGINISGILYSMSLFAWAILLTVPIGIVVFIIAIIFLFLSKPKKINVSEMSERKDHDHTCSN
jgi:hypothetical protein